MALSSKTTVTSVEDFNASVVRPTKTPVFRSVSRMLDNSSSPSSARSERRLSFGDALLDSVFNGGVYTGGVAEICGESASGKTQLCLQLCLSSLSLPSTSMTSSLSSSSESSIEPCVIFIATEDPFPSKRLQQLVQFSPIVKSSSSSISSSSFWTNNVLVDHVGEFEQLMHALRHKIPALMASRDVRLVVVDSVAAIFRCYENDRIKERWQHLRVLGKELHQLSGRCAE